MNRKAIRNTYKGTIDLLGQFLSEKRLEHSIRVAEEASIWAKTYKTDEATVLMAGLLHDVAKESHPKHLMAKDIHVPEAVNTCYNTYPQIWHSFAGPYVARQVFNRQDPNVLEAMRWHTTGCADMSLETQLIFLSDFTEPGRALPLTSYVRDLMSESLDMATYALSMASLQHLQGQQRDVHPESKSCVAYYEGQLSRAERATIRTNLQVRQRLN